MALRRKDGTWQVTKLPSGDWHPEEIKAAVRMERRGMNLARLAIDHGLHSHACAHAITRPHYHGELAIAELLGVSPAEIWPNRHDTNGTRICRVRDAAKPTDDGRARHRENRTAA